MDLSTAGYFVVIPALLLIASIWVDRKYIAPAINVYGIVVLFVITLIFLVDIVLYSYWGFRIDTTPLFYLKSPKDALASASTWMLILGILSFALCFAGVYWLFRRFVLRFYLQMPRVPARRVPYTVYMLTPPLCSSPLPKGDTS